MYPDELQAIIANQERIERMLLDLNESIQMVSQKWLTASEAAQYAGYSVKHFREEMLREIPHFQRDRRIMVKRSDLDNWMEANKKEPVCS